MVEVFVGCGSNIEPQQNLRWAVSSLGQHFAPLTCSSVYESPAFGFDGPDFLNMVVGFETALPVDDVEAVLTTLENERGRNSGQRAGSRRLDLDLLIYGGRVDAGRRLPRADVLAYPFVLAPLAEIAPALRHPVTAEVVSVAWQRQAAAATSLSRLGEIEAA